MRCLLNPRENIQATNVIFTIDMARKGLPALRINPKWGRRGGEGEGVGNSLSKFDDVFKKSAEADM